MRRENHSRIEKARRTKINDALAALRSLVPSDTQVPAAEEDEEEDDEYEDGKKVGKGKPKQEKEFKLEILIKTVAYVQELQERVRVLEQGSRDTSSHQTHRPQKRKVVEETETSERDGSVHSPKPPSRRRSPASVYDDEHPMSAVTTRNRLPSISSWLPNAHMSPSLLPADSQRQLMTPPTSTTLQPIASPQIPPALSLDLPAPSALAQSFTSIVRPRATSNATAYSPPWTPEDESAASLLLQIKTSTSPVLPKSATRSPRRLSEVGDADSLPRVQTPASLLGMKIERK
ncbi:hypothetical protein BV25DRAFT_1828468 [Artomyces pyxidatus]|uniref:Uncharacterized protein n=1 Tax=Artomyces pyxidatus TaxID=48021 RepID=A0ACB8SUY7_9AGAM|nr:hypothetical protein BV25DRAFT_1828468 [Artomyces pyxidatus]